VGGQKTIPMDEALAAVDPNVPLDKMRAQERRYLDHLKSQIERDGLQNPIDIRDGKIYDGNHRVAVLDELGYDEVPIQSNNAMNRQRGSVSDTGAGKEILKTQATRNALTNLERPEPKDMPPTDISTPGAKVSDQARRVGTTGQYRGAPRGTTTPQKLGALRKSLQQSLERGVFGRAWYDRSSKAARDLTADRTGLRDRYAGSIAVTSADTAVSGNAGFAIKGYNQLVAGDPVHTGRYPQRMSENIEKISSGEPVMLTDKVGPFFEANTLDEIFAKEIRPTNDLWMARAFGYTQKDPKTGKFVEWSSGLGEAQHRFMDEEMGDLVKYANKNKIGGFDDWTPERVQAAIWVDTKARREGTSIERAATDFATDLDSRSINITSESAPSSGLEHMEGVYGDPDRAKQAFDAQNVALTDDAGRNILSVHANALTRPQITGQGVYQGQTNPVAVNRILGGQQTGSAVIDPSSKKLADTIAATEGLVKGQDSVGYNFLREPKTIGEKGQPGYKTATAQRNAAVGPQRDIAEVQGALDGVFKDKKGRPTMIATPSEEGVRYLYVGGDALSAAQQKTLRGIVGKEIQFKQNSGDLVGADTYKPSAYLEKIDETIYANMDEATRYAADALEQLDDALAIDYPDAGPRSSVLQQTRQALIDGGIEKVKQLVKQGVLPATVLAVLVSQPEGQNALNDGPIA